MTTKKTLCRGGKAQKREEKEEEKEEETEQDKGEKEE
jgi:hypothetical protein